MKLSFIVPVYNVAPYLRKCVDSLLAQDYGDYEIILVDDGSTDESGKICDEYAASPLSAISTSPFSEADHSTIPIRVIHQQNGGLSAARNTGIRAANGAYLCFVDSDDYWEENVLGSLMEQVERENLDVLRFDYQNVRLKAYPQQCSTDDHRQSDRAELFTQQGKGGSQYEVFEPNKTPRYVDRRNGVVDGETYLNTRMSYACYAWAYIVRREIVPDFKEGIYFEDTEWTPRMLVKAKRVNAAQKIVYNYFWRSGSITKAYSREHIQKKIQSLIQVNLSLQNLIQIVSDKRWLNGCIADNVYSILNNVAAYDYGAVSQWIHMIKENNMLPLHGYNVRRMTILRYRIINFSPYLYCWLRHIRLKHIQNENKGPI